MIAKNQNIKTRIATVLRKIGHQKCLAQAEALENDSSALENLHLRDSKITAFDITAIANCLKEINEQNNSTIKSISLSYNPIADEGTIALIQHLPNSITEIGLVDCNITDTGGKAILKWMKSAPQLKMICMEQNHFSNEFKMMIGEYRVGNPGVMVVL